jgi:hypothetical protein
MAKSDFENLKVYQMSEKLADEIWMWCWDGIGLRATRSVAK